MGLVQAVLSPSLVRGKFRIRMSPCLLTKSQHLIRLRRSACHTVQYNEKTNHHFVHCPGSLAPLLSFVPDHQMTTPPYTTVDQSTLSLEGMSRLYIIHSAIPAITRGYVHHLNKTRYIPSSHIIILTPDLQHLHYWCGTALGHSEKTQAPILRAHRAHAPRGTGADPSGGIVVENSLGSSGDIQKSDMSMHLPRSESDFRNRDETEHDYNGDIDVDLAQNLHHLHIHVQHPKLQLHTLAYRVRTPPTTL